jgi:hypothetical protein
MRVGKVESANRAGKEWFSGNLEGDPLTQAAASSTVVVNQAKKDNYGSFVELVVQQTLDVIPTRLCAKHLSIIDWKTGEH